MSPALLKLTKRVKKPGVDEGCKPRPLLRRKAVVVNIGPRVGQVDLRVRYIEVAAKNDRLFLFQLLETAKEILVPSLPITQSRQVALGIGHVNVHQEK